MEAQPPAALAALLGAGTVARTRGHPSRPAWLRQRTGPAPVGLTPGVFSRVLAGCGPPSGPWLTGLGQGRGRSGAWPSLAQLRPAGSVLSGLDAGTTDLPPP